MTTELYTQQEQISNKIGTEQLSPEDQKILDTLEDCDAPAQPKLDLLTLNTRLLSRLITDEVFARRHNGISPKILADDIDANIWEVTSKYLKRYDGLPNLDAIKLELLPKLTDKEGKVNQDKSEQYLQRLDETLASTTSQQPEVERKWLGEKLADCKRGVELLEAFDKYKSKNGRIGKACSAVAFSELHTALAKISTTNSTATARPFEDANALLSLPDQEYLVEGLFPVGALGMVFGLPGCFKTFFSLDLALSLAEGKSFLNRFPVPTASPVAYISPEGTTGLKHRLSAWMTAHNIKTLKNVVINRNAFQLNDPEELEAVIAQVSASNIKPKLLIIDTLARNFAGDENSTKDMSAFVNNVASIGARLQTAILIVHHAGKDTSKGARGSIALTGAVDVSIEMVKADDGKSVSVSCAKMKDAEPFKTFTLLAKPTGESITLEYAEVEPASLTTDTLMPIIKLCQTPKTRAELEKLSGRKRWSIEQELALATKHGYLEKLQGEGANFTRRWQVSDKGFNLLASEITDTNWTAEELLNLN